MNEYKKKLAAQAGKGNKESSAPDALSAMTNGIPNSVLNDVFAGKKKATSEMMGHRMPLPPSIVAKMQQSFGLSVGCDGRDGHEGYLAGQQGRSLHRR